MKKYSKQDQKLLAIWAANCAKRVFPFFEKVNPNDTRPKEALKTCQKWIRTGIFKMSEIRGASLGAHAAARDVIKNDMACFAARAAGQAVATAHVPQHAFGAAYYALKAIATVYPIQRVNKEFDWQLKHAPEKLKKEIIKRIIIQEKNNKVTIKIKKDKNF